MAGWKRIENIDTDVESELPMQRMPDEETLGERDIRTAVDGGGSDYQGDQSGGKLGAADHLGGRAFDRSLSLHSDPHAGSAAGTEERMIRPTHARISREALRNNIGVIRSRLTPGTRVMGIVKADCYGHGTGICVPEMLAEGIDILGVATAEEGIRLRALGFDTRVVVLPPPLEGQYDLFAAHDMEAVVSTPAIADRLAGAAGAAGCTIRVHMFLDTGMGRNGAPLADALDTLRHIASLKELELVGFASHFATSDEVENPFTHYQLDLFENTLRRALDAGFRFRDIHIANSGGILNFPRSHQNLVRPGLSLYGYHPSPGLHADSGLLPVMSLRTIVANITRMPAGTSISYGRRYYTGAETRIATLPIGYADGLMRTLTNKLSVLIGSRRFPVVGTICMDEVMVDLGNAPVSIGDEVIVIGESHGERIDAWELANLAGTIPYEICTNVSARVPRMVSG